jgi:hypothetical protein
MILGVGLVGAELADTIIAHFRLRAGYSLSPCGRGLG